MSDIRTKLLLGTTLASIAMIFVMAAGVDAFDTKTATVVQSFGLNGHVTVMAIHPDGSASYAQADNAIITGTLTTAANQLFDAGTADPFDCISIGDGDGTGNNIQNPMNAAATAGPQCDADGTTNPGGDGIALIDAEFTILLADLTAGSVLITEATLENGAEAILSHVSLDTDVPAVEGTIVTITYTMTLAAGV